MTAEKHSTFDIPSKWAISSRVQDKTGTIFLLHDPKAKADYKLHIAKLRMCKDVDDSRDVGPVIEALRYKLNHPLEAAFTKICDDMTANSSDFFDKKSFTLPVIRSGETGEGRCGNVLSDLYVLALMTHDRHLCHVEYSPWPYGCPSRLLNLLGNGFTIGATTQLIVAPSAHDSSCWVVDEFQPCNIELKVPAQADYKKLLKAVIKLESGQQQMVVSLGNIEGRSTAIQKDTQRLVKNKKIRERTARGRGDKGGRRKAEAWKQGKEIRKKFAELQKLYRDSVALEKTIDVLGLDCQPRTLRKIIKSRR